MLLLLKNLLFTLVGPATVAVYVPLLIAKDGEPVSGWGMALAVPLLCLGAFVYAWCVWDFATFGRGTPAPIDAPKRMVVRGLYRYTRNPMYCGMLSVILGWLVLDPSLALAVYAVAVAGCFHVFTVLYEEPHLGRLFGEEYEAYRRRVGRWLPRVRRRSKDEEVLVQGP